MPRVPNKTDFRGIPEERFWSKVEKTNGCWLWKGATSKGYGRLGIGHKMTSAHRFSWELRNGLIPSGQQVLHKCDIRRCVNPDHLFLGTQDDNMKDCASKGRTDRTKKVKGQQHPSARLTSEQVLEIRALSASGALQRELALRFGVVQTLISKIVRREGWKHV